MTREEAEFLHDYAAAQAAVVRLRVLLAECPEGLRHAVAWELRHAEDAFAILEDVARERARRLAGSSESMTEAVVPPAVAVVGSLDPHTGRKA